MEFVSLHQTDREIGQWVIPDEHARHARNENRRRLRLPEEPPSQLHMDIRVEHGYTAGRVFPHRTRTRVYRYPLRVAPVPYRNSCGVQRYLQYLQGFFFIISLRTNLIVY